MGISDFNAGQAFKGAGGGALAGGAVGGLPGAVIGGSLGFFGAGLMGSGESSQDAAYRKMLMQGMGQGPLQAPQLGSAGVADYSTFRGSQSGLVSRLEAMANGTGPSLARQQFQAATDRNMRGQQAMAASGRGGPLSQLTAANNMAQLGANAAQGSAMARTNEQMQAIGQLGGVVNQGRMADEGVNMFNTGQQNQFSVHNLNSRLQTMGMDEQRRLQLLQMLGGLNSRQAGQPGFGDQLLAGGAGMFSQAASQKAQQRATTQAAPQQTTSSNWVIAPDGTMRPA